MLYGKYSSRRYAHATMTHALRTKLFVLFVALFCIIGVGLLFYTQGYRIDLTTWRIQKTGALYIETSVHPVSIELNNQSYQDKSSFIQRGTFISTVLPKRYRLIIGKDGYASYEKNIAIFPGQVTRLLHILMVPSNIATTTYPRISGDTIVDSTNGTQLITYDSAKKVYYAIRLGTPPTIVNLSSKIATLTRRAILAVAFYPQENNRFIVQTQAGLSAIDFGANTQTSIIPSASLAWWGVRNNNVYAVTTTSTPAASTSTPPLAAVSISVFDLSLAKIAQTYAFSLPVSSTVALADFSSSRAALVLKDGSLLVYSLNDGSYTRIADAAKAVAFSPDGSRLLYQDRDGKMFAYLFDDDIVSLNAPGKTALRVGVLEAARMTNFSWALDEYHVLCIYPDKITLAEITQSEPNEQFTVAPGAESSWYDADSKTLFTVASSTLTAYNLGF